MKKKLFLSVEIICVIFLLAGITCCKASSSSPVPSEEWDFSKKIWAYDEKADSPAAVDISTTCPTIDNTNDEVKVKFGIDGNMDESAMVYYISNYTVCQKDPEPDLVDNNTIFKVNGGNYFVHPTDPGCEIEFHVLAVKKGVYKTKGSFKSYY